MFSFDAVITGQGGALWSWHKVRVIQLLEDTVEGYGDEEEAPNDRPSQQVQTGSFVPHSHDAGDGERLRNVEAMRVPELKRFIREHGGNPNAFLERSELVAAARDLAAHVAPESPMLNGTSNSHGGGSSSSARDQVPVAGQPRLCSEGPGAAASVDDDDGDLCIVCQDQEKTHAFVPCGHRCVCETCCNRIVTASTGRICPLCRRACTSTIRIFG